MIRMKLTDIDDLSYVQKLWANSDVMRYVGFPDGLHETLEDLKNNWLPWVQNPPTRQHFSIFADGIGYCGESFYDVDKMGLACVDIKILPEARGKGIGFAGLCFALNWAFSCGNALSAYVDPAPDNENAIRLYERLGFHPTDRAAHLDDPGCPCIYMQLSREDWEQASWKE